MDRYFTKQFYKFFFGFAVIIGIAFAVLIATSAFNSKDIPSTANPIRPDDYDNN